MFLFHLFFPGKRLQRSWMRVVFAGGEDFWGR